MITGKHLIVGAYNAGTKVIVIVTFKVTISSLMNSCTEVKFHEALPNDKGCLGENTATCWVWSCIRVWAVMYRMQSSNDRGSMPET